MANLLALSELAYNQIFPLPREKTSITLVEFIESAKIEFAASMWIYRQEMIASDGQFQMPSDLLTESEPLPVVDNSIDVSGLKYLSALPGDLWLQNIGGLNCECEYVKSTLNLSQILCDDDSLGDKRPFYIVGKKLKFPKGAHTEKLVITYANTGTGLDPRVIEVNEYIASKVREKLLALYGKRMPVDTTNNNNPDL